MPQLLLESIEGGERESSHLHIERCSECGREWSDLRETWATLGEVPEVPVPAGVRGRFLEAIGQRASGNVVVPFRARPAARWIAQAAAVALLVGSFFAGRALAPPSGELSPGQIVALEPVRLSGSQLIPASRLASEIDGTPRIENVRFAPDPSSGDIRLAFDLTSEVTVTGRPGDESLANLLAYVLERRESPSHSRSATIQWIRDNWSAGGKASPELARALASVLKNDTHEGVRLKAIDALKSLPPEASAATQTALIDALRNDPNPAVRLKAVEALANIANAGTPLDPAMLDTLRQKAAQDDENLYVRVRAAEALERIDL
ncbi:MAG TPA: HEAT repeat domain-containing protein [Thermoanaerobaculia bacterium]|nr:HEAT repeat domain-containing protein [Thermoanaerobaculia bacterium]